MELLQIIHSRLILLTPIFILLTHDLAVFSHEYAHSLMAWVLGYKTNPLDIDYGGTSILNILLLTNINQNIDYSIIFTTGHPALVSLIAFAGPGIANGSLFIASYFLLRERKILAYPTLYYFLFLFHLMNLGNLYDYVPIRTFSTSGDVYDFITGLNISPWLVYVLFGYLVAFFIWSFFMRTLAAAYENLNLHRTLKISLMITCVIILFGFFGGYPYVYFIGQKSVGDITYFLSATSFFSIPGLIIALLPPKLNHSKGNK